MDKLLKPLLFAAFLNASCWIILTPLWQYPDEQAHFAQVQDFAEIGYVPESGFDTSLEIALSEQVMGTDRDGQGNNKYTYHPEYRNEYSKSLYGPRENEISNLPKSARKQLVKEEATFNPPLYYFLASIVYKVFSFGDLFTRVFAVRFMSLAFFLLTVFLVFKMSKRIFPKSQVIPIVIPTVLAFMPMFAYVSSGLFPDPLTNLLFTAVIFTNVLLLLDGISPKLILILISLIILGTLTRQQFLIAIAISSVSVATHLFQKPSLLKILAPTTLVLIVFLVILGRLLPSLSFLKGFSAPEIAHPDLSFLLTAEFLNYLKEFIRYSTAQTLPWYWGIYKWLSLSVPHLSYQIINRFIVISLAGLIVYFAYAIISRKLTKEKQVVLFLAVASIIYVAIFAIWDFFFRRLYNYPFGFQGRYFFPLISAHITLLIVGQKQVADFVLKKISKYYFYLIALLVCVFNIVSISHVSSSYYDTSALSTFVVQASQYKPEIFKGLSLYIIFPASLIAQIVYLKKLLQYVHSSAEN